MSGRLIFFSQIPNPFFCEELQAALAHSYSEFLCVSDATQLLQNTDKHTRLIMQFTTPAEESDFGKELNSRQQLLGKLEARAQEIFVLQDNPFPSTPASFYSDHQRQLALSFCAQWKLFLQNSFHGRIPMAPWDLWLFDLGLEKALDWKLWLEFKITIHPAACTRLVEKLTQWITGQSYQRKVLALDLDGTLWGGILSEDNQVLVGGPGAIGEFYQEFQGLIKTLKKMGWLLCFISKNEMLDVQNIFKERPDFPLKWDDFASGVANWQPKSKNLIFLAEQLNLGLESFVFIDDDASEIFEVASQLPQVQSLHLSSVLVDRFAQVAPLQRAVLAQPEDRLRQASRHLEQQREALQSNSQSNADYLDQLDVKVEFQPFSQQNLVRIHQLFQKTNQFNTALSRRQLPELTRLSQSSEAKALAYSVSDRFGDYGLTGALLYSEDGQILDWVMSCRILNRQVERKVLEHLTQLHGPSRWKIHFTPGPRNHVAKELLSKLADRAEIL